MSTTIFLNHINVFVVHFYWKRLIQKTELQLQVEGRNLTGREKKEHTSERMKVSLESKQETEVWKEKKEGPYQSMEIDSGGAAPEQRGPAVLELSEGTWRGSSAKCIGYPRTVEALRGHLLVTGWKTILSYPQMLCQPHFPLASRGSSLSAWRSATHRPAGGRHAYLCCKTWSSPPTPDFTILRIRWWHPRWLFGWWWEVTQRWAGRR